MLSVRNIGSRTAWTARDGPLFAARPAARSFRCTDTPKPGVHSAIKARIQAWKFALFHWAFCARVKNNRRISRHPSKDTGCPLEASKTHSPIPCSSKIHSNTERGDVPRRWDQGNDQPRVHEPHERRPGRPHAGRQERRRNTRRNSGNGACGLLACNSKE